MDGITRPDVQVLPDEALVTRSRRITPAPNQFTHELIRSQAYYFADSEKSTQPDGEFAIGTRVVLMLYSGGKYCRVVDHQGIYAEIEHSSLRKL